MSSASPPRSGMWTAAVPQVLVGALIATTTVVSLPRLTPIGNGDFLTFASVAQRVRDGDRLYIDVWDNKDPYFYYVLSLVGQLGGWAYFALELLWVVVSAVSLFALARSQGVPRRWSLAVAWGVAPWCLLGVAYAGTMSVMPGVAVTLAALAVAAHQRWAAVGALLGVLVFLKLTLVPVAVAGAAVFCFHRRRAALIRSIAAGLLTLGLGVAVLALRGELVSYLLMLGGNSQYAQRMVNGTGAAGFIAHLGLAFPAGEHPGERIALGAIVLSMALACALRRSRPSRLFLCAVAVLLSGLLVLGLTAVWPHHTQLLAVPASITLLALCEGWTTPLRTSRAHVMMSVCLVAAYLMGGATPLGQVVVKPTTAAQPLQQLRGISPEAVSIAPEPGLASYSRLGRNDRTAHARGLGNLELQCRHFQQYPFDPETAFASTLDCLPRSDVVFISDNFADQNESPSYVRFVTQARSILKDRFACSITDYGQKCIRKTS